MQKQQKHKIAAAIDIGSSVVRMHISQWDGRKVAILDKLEKPTQIGKEVFSTGYISFETVRSLSEILSGFCEKAREYGIVTVHTIASTALREASNQAYILDHLSTRNKLDVRVFEDTESSALLIDAMKTVSNISAGKSLLIYGGTGTTDFELLQNGGLILSHSVQTGLLKIAEMLKEASDFSRHLDYMAEEYLNTVLTRENRVRDLLETDEIIFGAGNLQPLFKLFGNPSESGLNIQSGALSEIYGEYRSLSVEQICVRHGFQIQQGEILYAMLTLLAALFRVAKTENIFCMQMSLADAMLNYLLKPDSHKKHNENLYAGAASSALDLAARYRCHIKHCVHTAEIALGIFEKLKKAFDFTKKQKLLLHIACILHESGHYVNSGDVQEASFNLLKDARIYGLSSRETLLAANIVAPQSLLGVTRALRGSMIAGEDILFAAKMYALLQLSDALDYSHKQKAGLRDLTLENDSLVISVQIREDFTLERWMFREKAELFQEIFGITTRLKINNIYHSEEK